MAKGPSAGTPGGSGTRMDDESRTALQAIGRWKQTAATEVDDIGTWRDADPSDRYQMYWCDPARQKNTEHASTMPRGFESGTTYLLGRLWDDDPKRDLTPIREVYAAVSAWHADHSAERIPEQRVLVQSLEQAMLVVRALEGQLSRRRGQPLGTDSEWHTDRSRLKHLLREMQRGVAGADTWSQIHGVWPRQDEAERLAIKLGFPGAPIKIFHHRQGEPEFDQWVGANPEELVEIVRYEQHDPIAGYSVGVIGGLRPGMIYGKMGFIEIEFAFVSWRDQVVKVLEAWEREIDGMRADGGLPFRYPTTNDFYRALGETSRACGKYAATLRMLAEPIEGAGSHSHRDEPTYVPPEQCLPPQDPEWLEMRGRWEEYRAGLDAGVKESYRRLDMYFATRAELDEAAARCEATADEAAEELKDDRKPVSEQLVTRVRAVLAEIRDYVAPWYRLGRVLSPNGAGIIPSDPAGEAESIKGLMPRLWTLHAEVRPVAEQRVTGSAGASGGESEPNDPPEPPSKRRDPVKPTRPVSLKEAAEREWFGKMDKRVLRDAIEGGVWAGKQVSDYMWVLDLDEVFEHAQEEATPKPPKKRPRPRKKSRKPPGPRAAE